eukprot:1771483-Prymnesium_polylepis.1
MAVASASTPEPMRAFARATDALVLRLRAHRTSFGVEEPGAAGLTNVTWRSRALQVACYPGNSTRYVRHTDNACSGGVGKRCNGRRLTVVGYLNERRDDPTDGALR